ncbi:MAG: exodeoxyribonuclease VII large subunit [Ramlibacter sp.]
MVAATNPATAPRIWQVGALCRAIADALEARFNPVAVRGEISGFSRAASGHCYFSLKDENGQIRCAMFRRAASLLDFAPRDGELVEVRGRLGLYEQRGDLQLVVEAMSRAGQGALFEQFLQLKARLEAEGLFDGARKRNLALMPRGIGVVTSLGAAALHDVVTALRRRVPHIPVVIAPAAVQGAQAPAELVAALTRLYQGAVAGVPIDAILLVRGGGSIEDLWAFNDERLARAIVQSPVPLVCGVGHETDFTIADFCADLRAPTPTAAAELVAQPREVWLGALDLVAGRLHDAALAYVDRQGQRLDLAASHLGRPSGLVARQQLRLSQHAQQLRYGVRSGVLAHRGRLDDLRQRLDAALRGATQAAATRLDRARLRLDLLDPRLVLQRGYAMLQDADGKPVTHAAQTRVGQALRATLADGEVDLAVLPARLI